VFDAAAMLEIAGSNVGYVSSIAIVRQLVFGPLAIAELM
jgi:hypothetical protein